ncbi:MAG: PIG-L family deacetylase [Candidatus Bathyarchaeia archaeon]
MASETGRMLVTSAHAADFCSRAGGTIASYVRRGWKVRALDLTYGERGESGSLWRDRSHITVDEVKRIREAEARAAAHVLGAEIRFMDFDDNPLIVDRKRMLRLVAEVRDFMPSIVLTHWVRDPLNPDHVVTANATVKACHYASSPGVSPETAPCVYPRVYFFEPSVPTNDLSRFRPDMYIDITQVFDLKLKALKELKTQETLPEWYRLYGELRAFQARNAALGGKEIKYAEAYKAFTPWAGPAFP